MEAEFEDEGREEGPRCRTFQKEDREGQAENERPTGKSGDTCMSVPSSKDTSMSQKNDSDPRTEGRAGTGGSWAHTHTPAQLGVARKFMF